jgi:hypothetical protein
MKLAWMIVLALGAAAAAESQAEIAAKVNQEGVDLMFKAKYAEATAKFRDAVARVPEPKYFFNLCTALFQTGHFGEALSACSAVGKNKPDQALQDKTDKLIARIKDEAKAQKIELAVTPEDAALATKLNEEGKAFMFGEPSDPERAAPKFRDATAHDPQAKYFFNLCTAEYLNGKYPVALDACKQVAARHAPAELQTKTDKLIVKIRDEAKSQHIKLD